MQEHVGELCDAVAHCQAVLHDLEGGSITDTEALQRIRTELARESLLRAMWELGYFPEGTPPPVVVGDH